MASVKLGSTAVNDFKVGSSQVDKIYRGSDLAWEYWVYHTGTLVTLSNNAFMNTSPYYYPTGGNFTSPIKVASYTGTMNSTNVDSGIDVTRTILVEGLLDSGSWVTLSSDSLTTPENSSNSKNISGTPTDYKINRIRYTPTWGGHGGGFTYTYTINGWYAKT